MTEDQFSEAVCVALKKANDSNLKPAVVLGLVQMAVMAYMMPNYVAAYEKANQTKPRNIIAPPNN